MKSQLDAVPLCREFPQLVTRKNRAKYKAINGENNVDNKTASYNA